mmetsp:Transcript_17646/g.40694  ORF Transcript_17646/g.40694 Transcript_17646/m.40694 type:complete len:486 (+) Transcript_17646:157-1614(+)
MPYLVVSGNSPSSSSFFSFVVPKSGFAVTWVPKGCDAVGEEKALNIFSFGLGAVALGVGRVIEEPEFPNENWGAVPELFPGGLIFKNAAPPKVGFDDGVVEGFLLPNANVDFPEGAADEPNPVATDPKPDDFPKVAVDPEPKPLPNDADAFVPPPNTFPDEEPGLLSVDVCPSRGFPSLSLSSQSSLGTPFVGLLSGDATFAVIFAAASFSTVTLGTNAATFGLSEVVVELSCGFDVVVSLSMPLSVLFRFEIGSTENDSWSLESSSLASFAFLSSMSLRFFSISLSFKLISFVSVDVLRLGASGRFGLDTNSLSVFASPSAFSSELGGPARGVLFFEIVKISFFPDSVWLFFFNKIDPADAVVVVLLGANLNPPEGTFGKICFSSFFSVTMLESVEEAALAVVSFETGAATFPFAGISFVIGSVGTDAAVVELFPTAISDAPFFSLKVATALAATAFFCSTIDCASANCLDRISFSFRRSIIVF